MNRLTSSLLLCGCFASLAVADQPNIVYILCDDLGYGDVHCLAPETSKIPTPGIDQLASQGMTFTDAHSGSSVCTPTRYGIMTGRYCWRTKLQSGVVTGFAPSLIADDRPTVASFLRDNGYATAAIGKWHLNFQYLDPETQEPYSRKKHKKPPVGALIPDGPIHRGFDYFHGFHHAREMEAVVENDRVIEHDAVVNMLPRLTKQSVKYIDSRAGNKQPFFLYVPLGSPHTPIVPSPEWQGKSGLGDYGDFVMQTDNVVTEISAALKRNGFDDDTLVVFTSDNGCSKAAGIPQLAEQGHLVSAHLRGSKADIWEGGHRVPFIVRWPGIVGEGTFSEQTICLNDLFATLAELTEQPIPADSCEDSVSFLPALSSKPIPMKRKGLVHHSISGHFAYRAGPWKLALAKGSGGWTSPKENQVPDGAPEAQLYDLQQDIAEQQNLYEKQSDVANRLLNMLERDVRRGRSTPGSDAKNDVDSIKLWKSKPKNVKPAKARQPKRGKRRDKRQQTATSVISKNRPNIIFLLADDQTFDSLGCYGNEDVQTPNLDLLATRGLCFDHYYNTTAICMASRANILTGLYEYRTGCNFGKGNLPLEHWQRSYPVQLREAGYLTAIAGKIGIEVEGVGLPEDSFDWWGAGPGQTHYQTKKNAAMKAYAEAYPHSTLSYGAFGSDFIAEAAREQKPFCLSISFKAPHRPVSPDPKFDDIYQDTVFGKPANFGRQHGLHFAEQSRQGRQYPRFISWGYRDHYNEAMQKYHQLIYAIDQSVGMLVDAVERAGVSEETVIIYTSDNGYFNGAHGYGSKVLPYEESSRAPMIVADPRNKSNHGNRTSVLSGNIDVTPTILELAGLSPSPDLDGRSLVDVVSGRSQSHHESLAIMNCWGPESAQSFGVISPNHKYIYWYYSNNEMKPAEELYNLQTDRLELHDLAIETESSFALNEMRSHYDAHIARIAKHAYRDTYRRYATLFDRNTPWNEKQSLLPPKLTPAGK